MEIGEVAGVKVCVSPEQFEEIKKQKLIEENKILKEQQEEIERLNNIIDRSVRYLKIHGYYDDEIGRIVEELNDDECTELLQILEDNVKEEFEELKDSDK